MPQFDPSKPYEAAGQTPSFDPNAPFEGGASGFTSPVSKPVNKVKQPFDKWNSPAIWDTINAANKYLVQPFEKQAQKGAEVGRGMAVEPMALDQLNDDAKQRLLSDQPLQPGEYQKAEEGARAQNPKTAGVVSGIGSFAGGVAGDVRNWPFLWRAPAQIIMRRLMSAGFSGLMAKNAIDQSKELGKVLDDESVPLAQKVEMGTNIVLGTAGAAAGGRGMAEKAPPKSNRPQLALPSGEKSIHDSMRVPVATGRPEIEHFVEIERRAKPQLMLPRGAIELLPPEAKRIVLADAVKLGMREAPPTQEEAQQMEFAWVDPSQWDNGGKRKYPTLQTELKEDQLPSKTVLAGKDMPTAKTHHLGTDDIFAARLYSTLERGGSSRNEIANTLGDRLIDILRQGKSPRAHTVLLFEKLSGLQLQGTPMGQALQQIEHWFGSRALEDPAFEAAKAAGKFRSLMGQQLTFATYDAFNVNNLIQQYGTAPADFASVEEAVEAARNAQLKDVVIAKNTQDGTIKLLVKSAGRQGDIGVDPNMQRDPRPLGRMSEFFEPVEQSRLKEPAVSNMPVEQQAGYLMNARKILRQQESLKKIIHSQSFKNASAKRQASLLSKVIPEAVQSEMRSQVSDIESNFNKNEARGNLPRQFDKRFKNEFGKHVSTERPSAIKAPEAPTPLQPENLASQWWSDVAKEVRGKWRQRGAFGNPSKKLSVEGTRKAVHSYFDIVQNQSQILTLTRMAKIDPPTDLLQKIKDAHFDLYRQGVTDEEITSVEKTYPNPDALGRSKELLAQHFKRADIPKTWQEAIVDPVLKQAKQRGSVTSGFRHPSVEIGSHLEKIVNLGNLANIYRQLGKAAKVDIIAQARESLLRLYNNGVTDKQIEEFVDQPNTAPANQEQPYISRETYEKAKIAIANYAADIMGTAQGLSFKSEGGPKGFKGGSVGAASAVPVRSMMDDVANASSVWKKVAAKIYRQPGMRTLAALLNMPKGTLLQESANMVRNRSILMSLRDFEVNLAVHTWQKFMEENGATNDLSIHRLGYAIQGDLPASDLTPAGRALLKELRRFTTEQDESLYAAYGADLPLREAEQYLTQSWSFPDAPDVRERAVRVLMRDPFLRRKSVESYKTGIEELGMTPKFDNVLDLIRMRANYATRAVLNQHAANTMNAMGVVLSDVEARHYGVEDWPKAVESRALDRAAFSGTTEKGDTILSRRSVHVHPDWKLAVDTMFSSPFSNMGFAALDSLRVLSKKMMLSGSFFHHIALSEQSVAIHGLKHIDKGIKGTFILNPDAWRGAGHAIIELVTSGKKKGDPPVFTWRKDMVEDAIIHGLNLSSEDIEHATVEAARHAGAGLGPLGKLATAPVRLMGNINFVWDKALWDYYHQGQMLEAYHTILADELTRLGKGASKEEIETAKRQITEHLNNAYGSVNFERLLLTPKARQVISWIMLAPAWTYSNAAMGMRAIKGFTRPFENATGAKLARKWAVNAGISWFVTTQMLNYALTGYYNMEDKDGKRGAHFTWDNPGAPITFGNNTIGHRTHTTENVINIGAGYNPDGTQRYIRFGKAFREPFLWALEPIQTFSSKLSPPLKEALTQITGHEPGTGFTAIDPQRGNVMGQRAASAIDLLLPFFAQDIARGVEHKLGPETFPEPTSSVQFMSQPTARGMTKQRAVDAYAQAIEAGDRQGAKMVLQAASANGLLVKRTNPHQPPGIIELAAQQLRSKKRRAKGPQVQYDDEGHVIRKSAAASH